MFKTILAILISISMVSMTPAFAGPRNHGPQYSQGNHKIYRHRPRNNQRHRPPRFNQRYNGYYNRGYYNNNGSADLVIGLLGLGTALIIANQNRVPYYTNDQILNDQWNTACSRKYNSYNPNTGQFFGYDGYFHYCKLP